ncbi:lysozyme inhibitor LprI family protein [Acidovorax sp. RAC01]|uniref:lysozyme inhibitor LprI family protein n=1 Tax=Acidovorax sp. RAC01 TaxID=1842533 RepID=UPI0008555F89|nr:lysozyme inhibitor LprI family protein [Acidovorax sp. RAC01]AOG23607.1 hypothetical protein BSY15_3393 [Acidovorax sp. RAC01]
MVFGAACVMLMSTNAHAQAGAACKPGGTVEETNACAVQEFQAADTTHQILYEDVMRALSAHERPQLRQEHSAWLRERTAQCKRETKAAETQPEGPRVYHQCLTRKTQERRRGLMRWLSANSPARP